MAIDVRPHGIGYCVCTLDTPEVVENEMCLGDDGIRRMLSMIASGGLIVSDDPERTHAAILTLAEQVGRQPPPCLRVTLAHTGTSVAALRAYEAVDHARHIALATALSDQVYQPRPQKRARHN